MLGFARNDEQSLPTFVAGARVATLQVKRMPQAKRMRLSVDPRDGGVRLILPARAALRPALAWVEGKRGWIEQALAALPARRTLGPGSEIPFEGGTLLIDWSADGPRLPKRDGDRLLLGGDPMLLAPRTLRWLKRAALDRLEAETRAIAAAHGLAVGKVAVGDPRTRWGSCSSAGDIRYSWRLILAPPEVLRATVAHELGHRLHMDHSAAFHAAVARLFGRDPAPEIAWLRANGAGLYWVG